MSNVFVSGSGQLLTLLQLILVLAALVGSVFVFRNTRKVGIVQIQSDTIEAMQKQIDALKEQNAEQQKKLDRQDFELQAMREALEDEGIFITIDGKKVTIRNANDPGITRHIIKKPSRKTTTTSHVVKKEEEKAE